MSGPRYFGLAQRTFAYSGVMAARAAAQDDDTTTNPREAPRTQSAPTRAPEQVQSVAALAARFPDEIELVKVAVDG
ncbi:hypothetical protein ABZ401_19400 [Streptomyces sp. NPDC005892]|uniref:hypothetical protein n=1 Tax=Streptomyces sp. NPDC005892 TaxID=3155593 RepID=UPI0033EB2CFE